MSSTCRGELWIAVQAVQNIGVGKGFFQEMLEALAPAMQARVGHRLRQLRSALIQEARQVAGGRRGFGFLFLRDGGRCVRVIERLLRVDHAIVNFLHGGAVLVERLAQRFGR